MTTKNSLTHSALLPIEHVAEVMPGHNLHWAGTGPIMPLSERTGVKVGSKLITIEQAHDYIERELEKIRNTQGICCTCSATKGPLPPTMPIELSRYIVNEFLYGISEDVPIIHKIYRLIARWHNKASDSLN